MHARAQSSGNRCRQPDNPATGPTTRPSRPDGRRAYVVNTGSKATQITVIDPETFTVVSQIEQDPVQGLAPHAIAFDPATQRMFVANKDGGTLSAIDVATDTVVGYVPVGEEPHGVARARMAWSMSPRSTRTRSRSSIRASSRSCREIADPALVGPHQILFIPER